MMWLKSCPRCTGDLFLERALGETTVACLQCGHALNQMQERGLTPSIHAAVERRERRRRAA